MCQSNPIRTVRERSGRPGEQTKPIRWTRTWAGRPCLTGDGPGGGRGGCAKRTQFGRSGRAGGPGRTNEAKFGGLGHGRERPCYGARPVTGAARCAERTQFGPSDGGAGGVCEQNKANPVGGDVGAARPCYGDSRGGEMPQFIPIRCRWYKQSQAADGERKRAFAGAFADPNAYDRRRSL